MVDKVSKRLGPLATQVLAEGKQHLDKMDVPEHPPEVRVQRLTALADTICTLLGSTQRQPWYQRLVQTASTRRLRNVKFTLPTDSVREPRFDELFECKDHPPAPFKEKPGTYFDSNIDLLTFAVNQHLEQRKLAHGK